MAKTDESAQAHAVGIDLGTTFSSLAYVNVACRLVTAGGE
jgi:molecular chaperone DnaK (HSP70)